MAKTSRKRRKFRGVLAMIGIMFLTSGFLRVGLEATQATAKETEPDDTAEMTKHEPEETQCITDPDLIPLLDAMDQRDQQIQEKEEKIEIRMEVLKKADEEIEIQLKKLKAAEAELRKLITIADDAAEADVSRLTAVYENMKSKDAAALFEEMAPEFAAGFLGRMRPEAAAGVMTGLKPETAYTISVILAGRNANAPKK